MEVVQVLIDSMYYTLEPAVWSELRQTISDQSDSIDDIYDGNAYKKCVKQFCQRKEHYITLMCNTDGVQIYKSSKLSIWPIWLVINELPPSMR